MKLRKGRCIEAGRAGVKVHNPSPTWAELEVFCRCGESKILGKLTHPFKGEQQRLEIIKELKERGWCEGKEIRCPKCAIKKGKTK